MTDETQPLADTTPVAEPVAEAPTPVAPAAPAEPVVAPAPPVAALPAFDQDAMIKAQGDLGNALMILSPIVSALNGAGRVLDVMANALVYQRALKGTVDDLLVQVEDLKAQRANWTEMAQLSMQRAVDAEKEASARVALANAVADEAIATAQANVDIVTAAAQERTNARVQELAQAVAAATDEHATAVIIFDAAMADMQKEHDTLAAKLDSLKISASKFAAALQG